MSETRAIKGSEFIFGALLRGELQGLFHGTTSSARRPARRALWASFSIALASI